MHKIGDTIKRLRLKKGLTQRQLGNLMKVSGAKICTTERSSLPITTKTLLKFAVALNVSPAKLMYEDWGSCTPTVTTTVTTTVIKELNKKIERLDQQIFELHEKIISLYEELHAIRKQFPTH